MFLKPPAIHYAQLQFAFDFFYLRKPLSTFAPKQGIKPKSVVFLHSKLEGEVKSLERYDHSAQHTPAFNGGWTN